MKLSLMLAKSVKADSLGSGKWSGYCMEPKYDGMRCAIVKKNDQVTVYGRSWIEYTEHVPHIVEACKKFEGDFHMDGELAFVEDAFEFKGQNVPVVNFNRTMRVMGSLPGEAIRKQAEGKQLTFIAFDLLEGESGDIREFQEMARRSILVTLVGVLDSPWIQLTPRWCHWSPEMYSELVSMGIEGVMMKNTSSQYAKGRPNKTWYKVKAHQTADVVIMGYTKGTGKYRDMIGAVVFGQWWRQEDGSMKLCRRGQCSGMTDAERKEFTVNGNEHLGSVMEVKYNGIVGTWGFRHPNFVCFRVDKTSEECTWDGQDG